MADDATLGFKLKVSGGEQARDELGRFTKKVKDDVTAANDSILTNTRAQVAAAEQLQRQRNAAFVSMWAAMDRDLLKSAASTDKTSSLTDKLIADSQRAIQQAQQVAAGAGQSIENTGKKIAAAQQEAASLSGRFSSLLSAAAPLAIGVGAVGAAAIGAGVALFGLLKHASDVGSQLFDLEKKTGLNAESLSALKFAAEQSGSSIQEASQAVVLFQKRLTEAAQGNETLRKLFKTLGIDIVSDLKDPNKALRDLSNVLNGPMPEGFNKTTLAQQLMGRAGANLVSTFDTVGGSFDEFIEKARGLGIILTESDLKAADEFGDTLDLLGTQVEALGNKFALSLAPTVSHALSDMSDSFVQHRETITAGSQAIVIAIGNQIREYEELLGLLGRVAGARDQAGGGRRISVGGEDIPIPEGMTGEEAIHYANILAQSKGLENPENRSFSGTQTQEDLAKTAAEKARARAAAEKATQESLRAAQTAAESAFRSAVAQAEEAFRKTNDYVAFIKAMKEAEKDRWEARKAQFEAEKKEIKNRVLTEQETDAGGEEVRKAQLKTKNEEEIKARVDFNVRMAELDREANDKSLADLQLRHRRERELDQLRANEYVQIQQRAAEQGRITFVKAEQNLITDQRESYKKRIEALEAEQSAAVGDAKAYEEISHQLEVLRTESEIFERSVSGKIAGALAKDTDRFIEQLEHILSLTKELEKVKPVEIPGIGGIGKYAMPTAGGQTGPWVDPSTLGDLGAPPPPNLDPWHQALNGLKDIAGGTFSSIKSGFASMVQGFLTGGAAAQTSLKAIAKAAIASLAAQAIVQALMETAYGIAELAKAAANPLTAAQHIAAAHAHFAAAAAFGLVGGGAAIASAAFGGSGASDSTSTGQSSNLSSPTAERDRTIREGRTGGAPNPNEPLGVVGHVVLEHKYPDGHAETQIVRLFRANGPLRSTLRADLLGEAPSY